MPPPDAEWTAAWEIPAGDLRGLIEKTAHAISVEQTRYYLNGIYLHVPPDSGVLHATTTDGHRLMIARAAMPKGDAPLAQIFPRVAVVPLRPMLAAVPPGRILEIRQRDSAMRLAGPGWTLTTKTIDGKFPDYERVVPTPDVGTPLAVDDAHRLIEALRTVTAITADRSRPVKLCNGTGTSLRLQASGAGDGDCEFTVPGEVAGWRSNGEHPEIGFQARYVIDVCRVFATGGFVARVQDSHAPMRIDGPAGTAVLMPMRV